MSRELTYHDLKEEQELADKLIELDKAILVRKIINKNRLIDEYAKEINELQEGYEFGCVLDETLIETNKRLQQRIDKAIKLIEEIQNFPHTNINQHKDMKELKMILKGELNNE